MVGALLPALGSSVRIYRFNGIEVLQEQPYHSCRPLSPLEDLAGKEDAMRRDDIMQTELVSEIVLLTSGILAVKVGCHSQSGILTALPGLKDGVYIRWRADRLCFLDRLSPSRM